MVTWFGGTGGRVARPAPPRKRFDDNGGTRQDIFGYDLSTPRQRPSVDSSLDSLKSDAGMKHVASA